MDIITQLDGISMLINQLKNQQTRLQEIDEAKIIKVSIKGVVLDIKAIPVRNSVNPIEKLTMTYLDGIKEVLLKERDVMKDELVKGLSSLETLSKNV